MINRLEQGHTFDASIAVGSRFTALTVPVVINSTFIGPESDATAIRESFVILRPVAGAALLVFLFHKLNITASPHPRYLCSNARLDA